MSFVPTTAWNPDAHRRHALCSALAMWADDLQRLASRHPDGEQVLRECLEETPITLDRLLWDELEGRESSARRAAGQRGTAAAQPRTTAGYWLRRRKLALHTEMQALVGVLPDLWRVLMDRKPKAVEAFSIRVGLACLALAQAEPSSQVDPAAWEEPTQRRVRQVASTLDPIALPASVLAGWGKAFTKQSQRSGEDKALRALGMSVLSGLFQRLPHATRAAMARHFQSSLCVSLAAGRPLHRYTSVEAELLESSLVRLFGHDEDDPPVFRPDLSTETPTTDPYAGGSA